MIDLKEPIIDTDRLLLRPFQEGDALFFYINIASDYRVTKYLLWPPTQNMEEMELMLEQWIKDSQESFSYRFALLEKNSFEVIGMINIVEIDYQTETMEIGYMLAHRKWNKGYMREGLEAVMNFLFQKVKVKGIKASVFVNNISSLRLLKNLGFQIVDQDTYDIQGHDEQIYHLFLKAQ
ncbi:MAG TPA: GNAT family N-acetyltransferase [Bacilli bacterium]|nr:GNAT family N-acetyltransferase [Bacilli bacterium]